MSRRSTYQRVLLKLSGESLVGKDQCSLDYAACEYIAGIVKAIQDLGIEVGVVIGGGNIFRGSHASTFGFERTPADQIGILATCINGLALHQVLLAKGAKARVMSSRNFDGIIPPYNWQEAKHNLEKGIAVIFVGGTGNPYFTTDSAAALRAVEMDADILLKATKVDGVYDKDPALHADAKKYDELTYEEALELDLKVMDATAIALCRDNQMEIRVVNLFSESDIIDAVNKKPIGTLVTKSKKKVHA